MISQGKTVKKEADFSKISLWGGVLILPKKIRMFEGVFIMTDPKWQKFRAFGAISLCKIGIYEPKIAKKIAPSARFPLIKWIFTDSNRKKIVPQARKFYDFGPSK